MSPLGAKKDILQPLGINGNIRKVQRLFREEVHHKLMVMEMGDLNKMSEDIVSPSVVIQRSS